MRIIILGAGRVGLSLARNLAKEAHDVVLIDQNVDFLEKIKNQLDVQTVAGLATSPLTLIQSGIEQADLLIAVTDSDDTNILACYIAHQLFSTPKTIAKIKAKDYFDYPKLFQKSNIPITVMINAEQLITDYITSIIEYPGISELLYFSDDKTCLLTLEVAPNAWINGKKVSEIKDKLLDLNGALVAIFSQKKSLLVLDSIVLGPKDKLLFITREASINALLKAINHQLIPNKRITIAGGGLIGAKLAESIQDHYQLKLIEQDSGKAAALAESLNNVQVICGDIADRDLLLEENIEDTDLFCAITNDDEANIMGCLQAKSLGARYAMALVNREGYVDLIEESLIDFAISPEIITIGNILSKLKRGSMIKVHRLQKKEAEIIELIVEGTAKSSAVVGRLINDIEFPPDCVVMGVLRDNKLLINLQKIKLAHEDHLILLLLNKKYIHQLEALFQVNLDFLS